MRGPPPTDGSDQIGSRSRTRCKRAHCPPRVTRATPLSAPGEPDHDVRRQFFRSCQLEKRRHEASLPPSRAAGVATGSRGPGARPPPRGRAQAPWFAAALCPEQLQKIWQWTDRPREGCITMRGLAARERRNKGGPTRGQTQESGARFNKSSSSFCQIKPRSNS